MRLTFYIDQLANGAWIVGINDNPSDEHRFMPLSANNAGFATYNEAEKYAIKTLRKKMREQRDTWAKKAAEKAKQK